MSVHNTIAATLKARPRELGRAVSTLLLILILPAIVLAVNVRLDVPFKSQVPPPSSDKWPVDDKGQKKWPATKNCGQTCVLMISSYYKNTIPTEQDIKTIDDWLFQKFGDPVNGYLGSVTNTAKLVTLATEFAGFTDVAKRSNWTLNDLRNELNQGFPVIVAVWTGMSVGGRHEKHFMVLTGMDDNFVYVNDPGRTHGKDNKYSISLFMDAWTNQGSAAVTIHGQIAGRCNPAISGMVGLWPGDGNANDVVNGNNGTAFNGVTFSPGMVGQSFSFDGIDDHVRVSHSPILNSTNALTLDAWIFPTSFPVSSLTFFGKWDSVDGLDQRSYAMNVNAGGTFTFYINTDGSHENFQTITSSNNLPLNAWSHVAGVYDGSTMKVYVNGELRGQKAYGQGVFAGTADVSIGAIASGGPPGQSGAVFAGRVDDAAIYNRALSASEILSIFNAGSAGKCR